MKTKIVIEKLKELDPTGELDVTAGLADIHYIDRLPSFYDGYQQILVRDTKEGYPESGRWNTNQDKIVINSLSFDDAIYNDSDFPIDYSGLSEERIKRYKAHYDKVREESDGITSRIHFGYLLEAVTKKAIQCDKNLDGLYDATKEYFNKVYNVKTEWIIHPIFNMTWTYKDGETIFSKKSTSFYDALQNQFMHTLSVKYDNGWVIEEIEDRHYPKDFRDKAEEWWNNQTSL